MTNKMLEQRIRTAVEHAAPDCLDSILSSCDQTNQTVGAPQAGERRKGVIHMKSNRKPVIAALAAVAAAFVLCLGGFGLMQYQAAPQIDSVILLDVNPSLSLSVDAGEKVLAVEALNDDAKEVLGTMELKGTSLEVAVNAIIGSMLQKGYLGDAQNSILVSVENADAARGQQIRQKLSQLITAAMQTDAVDAAVLTQNVSADDDALKELAKAYEISIGKAALIQEVIAQDPTLTFEDLAPLTINEISLIAASRDWSSEAVSQSGTASDAAYIGRDEALNLACAQAGITTADLQKFEVELDSDHGVMIYEVELETASLECEYEIDALTGAILKAERQEKKDAGKPENGTVDSAAIGEDAAKAAALAHAGVQESDTYYIKCYVEYENGQPEHYTVEFETAQAEYDYEIDLYSGAVLEADRENKTSGSTTSGSSSANSGAAYIGENAAKAAALAHAGVQESDTYYLECYVEYENGKPACYGVKFGTAQAKYEYEIDLYSGAVLEADRENKTSGSTSSGGSTNTGAAYIGESAAKAAALAHAGVQERDTYYIKCYVEYENGQPEHYTVEFKTAQAEYEYEIDLYSGAVLDYEKENH